jgi:hypothetical protein
MDSAHFDRITRTLSSRRSTLGGLAAVVTRLVAAPLHAATQSPATCRRLRQTCLPGRGLDCCQGMRCQHGRCRCSQGERPCRGRCISANRCCGTHCPGELVCRAGRCRCPRRAKRCGVRCLARTACCRGKCGSGQVCRGGHCRPACEGVVCPACQTCDPANGVCAPCEFCCDGVTCCPSTTVQCCPRNACMPCLVAPFSLVNLVECAISRSPDECPP